MNPKKRKANENEEETVESSDEKKQKENDADNIHETDLKSTESSDITDGQQKSDNGGILEVPGPSEEKISVLETNNLAKQTLEQSDRKRANLECFEKSGCLLFCGGTNWDLIGRKELPKNAKGAVGNNLWGPHRFTSLQGIKVASVISGTAACHSIIITSEGQAMSWGRNDKGQLGHCDMKRRDLPTIVETLKDHLIIGGACGRSHTCFLSDKGILYSCGDNKMGQCGVGSQNVNINIPTKVPFKGRAISHVACGAEFSVIVDSKGGLHSFGCPEYGQLGHNSDGRYFVTSNKLSFQCELVPRRIIAYIEKTREGHVTLVDDVQIVSVACGVNHSVAVDSKKRCFSWGFGGYGRLGHSLQQDEMVPRLIKTFDGLNRGVKKVFAGGTYSLAINEHDVLFFFGQNKRSGESTMYPKPVPDLVGWKVRDVGCANCSIVCIADESVISWGPSPTWGELGYGESRQKSSTTPQEVKPLDGIHIEAVSCGYAHTLFIARDESEDDRTKINQLPEFIP